MFEDTSLFKQIYKQEIIVAVMEASKLDNVTKRVMFVSESYMSAQYSQSATTTVDDNIYDDDSDEEEKKTADTQASSGLPKFESEVVNAETEE